MPRFETNRQAVGLLTYFTGAKQPLGFLARVLQLSLLISVFLLPGTAATAEPDLIDATRVALKAAIQYNTGQRAPATLAREQLLLRSSISDIQLAPNGRYLSLRKRGTQQTDLLLQDLDTGQHTRILADLRQLDVSWSGDSQRLWLADDNGLAVFELRERVAKRILKWDRNRQQRFITVDLRAPRYAIIQEKVAHQGAWLYRYLLVDPSGKTQLLHEASQALRDVLLDANGALAYTAAYDGAQYDTVVRRHTAAGVQELRRCVGIEQCRLLGYNASEQTLWLLSHHQENTLALQRWQANSKQWQTVHRDPAGIADAVAVLWQHGTEEWLGIAYHRHHRQWFGNGATHAATLAALHEQLPDANLNLRSAADGKRWLVQARHASWQADRYYLYAPAQNVLTPLFESEQRSNALIAPTQLAAALPLSYRARDGMLLHGYVHLPRGVDLTKVPLIASIHGGPYNREQDHYDAIIQLLVNRGYAVFTPNFRASTGYGLRYMRAAQDDFGNGKVLGDIIGGLDFLLANGIGDQNRQAVIGHSFGGYASLLAVSHFPARFRFAVASAGPAEFTWSMQWIADNGGSAIPENGPPAELFFSHYGIQLADTTWQQTMRRESPLAQVAQLRAPLYLWAGAKDDRVPLKSISHYAGEAKRHDKALSLLIDPDAGHGPNSERGMEAIVYLIEAAAHRHFAGALTPPSAQLAAFLKQNMRIDSAGLLTETGSAVPTPAAGSVGANAAGE